MSGTPRILARLRARRGLWLCVLLTLLIVTFIFTNSLENGEESRQSSDVVVDTVKPIVDPQDRIDRETFSFSIRKLAHFTEFFWLGMALCGVVVGACRRGEGARPLLSYPPIGGALLLALLTAVTDEWIQSFTGRTSSVSDVLLDFFGALCGFGLTALAVWLILRRKRKHG